MKLAAKRAERAKMEISENKEREKMRRFTGKEIVEAKERAKEIEMKKAFEERKRDKEREQAARMKIKAQIEEDKRVRAEKFEREKQLRAMKEGGGISPIVVASAPPPASAASSGAASATIYTETRLQLRLPQGPPIVQSFKASDPLQLVCDFIVSETKKSANSFSLSCSFPRFWRDMFKLFIEWQKTIEWLQTKSPRTWASAG